MWIFTWESIVLQFAFGKGKCKACDCLSFCAFYLQVVRVVMGYFLLVYYYYLANKNYEQEGLHCL